MLGQQKVSTVTRWVVLAKDLSPQVLKHISGWRDVPQAFVIGNRYLVGKAAEGKLRLHDEWAIVAFDWYVDAKDQGRAVRC